MRGTTSGPDRGHLHRAYLLSAEEFEVLWEALAGTDRDPTGPPAVLGLGSPGRTRDARQRVRAAVWRALRERGLAGSGGPVPGLVRRLCSLARPAEQLELRASWDGRLRAVAAGRDGPGALAIRRGDVVLVTGAGSLPSALLSALPPARPGIGRTCTVPTPVLSAAAAAPQLVPALVAAGAPAGEARLLERMLGSVRRRAQVVALVESAPDGPPRRRGGVVGVLDGRDGRYLVSRTTGPDGTEWTSVGPADPRRLRHRIGTLLRG
jgi:hypothetical protein